ncbi:MAG: aminopeptidase [Candidatus Omnitrophica bacterium]|nr:aminopeptidase [Candidatus Omnitrophota bacterium]
MIKKEAIEAVFRDSLKLKPQESCLILTDTIKENIARSFYEHALKLSKRAELMIIKPTAEHSAEPPKEAALKMLEYDVQLLITEKSLTHTRARRQATSRGHRIATMPGITEDTVNRCLDIDYLALEERSKKLCSLLKATEEVKVITASGTDIKFSLEGSEFFGQNGGSFGLPKAFGNLPEGEVSFSPSDCEGVYVVDLSFPGLGILESPITFRVKNCFVYKIEGGKSSQIIERLDKAGPLAYRVAELGIGLNPKARVIGSILEDEKVISTVHIAVGNNLSYGRDNDVPLHLDGVISKPDIYLDKEKIMDKGDFLIF